MLAIQCSSGSLYTKLQQPPSSLLTVTKNALRLCHGVTVTKIPGKVQTLGK